jgi:acyl-CoA synthetase (AMP-forming)/AMP-acid ligase II
MEKYDFSHVRHCMVGAAPLGEDLFTAFRKRFPQINFGQGYGAQVSARVI